MTFNNTNNNITSGHIQFAATSATNITGKHVSIISNDTSSDAGMTLESRDGIKLKTASNKSLYIETPQIDLSSHKTHVQLLSSDDALKFDTNTLVVDAKNHRVGVGQSDPQATLHVGGDTRLAGNVALNSGYLSVINGSTHVQSDNGISLDSSTISIDASTRLNISTPAVHMVTPTIDLYTQQTTVKIDSTTPGGLKLVSADPLVVGQPVDGVANLMSCLLYTSDAADE